ncbi:MAG: hypothetical protein GY874_10585 [Desulfobacteraceae bacterium]|nr:hypothetical protein [Desulfobacteraceae bacterium]
MKAIFRLNANKSIVFMMTVSFCFLLAQTGMASETGQRAQMFQSIDQFGQSIDMEDYIDGKPLVLILSSST